MERPAKQSEAVNWSEIFDSIASEYGYTWDQFTGLTYKLLDACLESIAKRQHNKTSVYAAMHGIKMDLYRRNKPVSEKTLQQAEKRAYELLKQKREAVKNGK